MRIGFLLLLFFQILLAQKVSTLFFNQKHFELHLGIDKDGGFIPAFRVPFRWNERLSSSIRFSQSMNAESGTMVGYTGQKTVQGTVREIGINFLSYHFGDTRRGFLIGGGASYERLERHEFGFFHYALLGEDVAFENSYDIHLLSPTIECDFWLKRDHFFLDVQSSLRLVSALFFEQEILFNPLLKPESSTDRSWNIPMVKLSMAPYVKIHPAIWLGFYGEANYMKISHKRAILDYTSTYTFTFTENTTDFTELILMAESRIVLTKFSLGGAIPFLGGGVKYIREEMDALRESGTIPYFSFGLEVL